TRQAIHLVDDDCVDPASLDVGEQAGERGPLHVAAGEAAIVVAVGQAGPALVLLAADVRLAAVALGVEGVEFLLQPLPGALAGVHGAAQLRERRPGGVGAAGHRSSPFPPTRKNKYPLQWLPVIALATAESEP